MARVVFHEHPRQRGACLPGAFASYVKRIPIRGYADLDAIWQAVRQRPYEADHGPTYGVRVARPSSVLSAEAAGDARCSPVQRSRVWPDSMNCWEASAHFTAGAKRLLANTWTVHVWDRDLPNGARHLWPSLISPKGDHLLVDLKTVASTDYPVAGFSGSYGPGVRLRKQTLAPRG